MRRRGKGGPAAAMPAVAVGFHASYLKHYTASGSNALATFNLDVSIHDAVSVAADTNARLDQ